MIQKHSNDPDVAAAARQAGDIVARILRDLPAADTYDYGGHNLKVDEYGMCTRCTSPIAEAQLAERAIAAAAQQQPNEEVKEHLDLAARLMHLEAEAALVRAELHNGHDSEHIVNLLLGFLHDHQVHDAYDHSHHGNAQSAGGTQ